MKKFLSENKVLLSAIVSALVLVFQQALATPPVNPKAIALASLIAILGVIANQWRGKGLTILGILGNMSYAFVTIWQTGSFTWNEFFVQALLAVLTAILPSLQPAKEEA